jgi:predicted nucleotidyltransferase
MEDIELIRNVGKWGNSGGILVPKELIGNQVRIITINRTDKIKKEVLNILLDYLEDVIGIYLTGSYSRGDQEESSDIDIIVITNKIKKEIKSGKYHLSLIPLQNMERIMEKNPLMIAPRLMEAKEIINPELLKILNKKEVKKNSFKNYVEETKRIILINKGLINLEKDKYLTSPEIIYSVILRLRGVYLIKCILKKNNYLKKDFLKYLENSKIPKKEVLEIYKVYRNIRDNTKIEINFKYKLEEIKSLLNFLEKENKSLSK